MVVFGKKLLYSGKVVVIGKTWLYFLQSGSIWAERLFSCKGGCIRVKSGCFRTK